MERVNDIILGKTRGKWAVFIAFWVFMGGYEMNAANNPLASIRAEHYDDKSAGVKMEDCTLGGRDICSIHNGDYVLYKAYDFDSGVAGFKAMIASKNEGRIEIHLDNLTGPLLGTRPFEKPVTGKTGRRSPGARLTIHRRVFAYIYLVIRGSSNRALVNVSTFQFLKSLPAHSADVPATLSNRVDSPDAEPSATGAWGVPAAGFHDDFKNENLTRWIFQAMSRAASGASGYPCLKAEGTNLSLAYTPDAYINETDTGGDWRTMAEASLAAEITLNSTKAEPGALVLLPKT